MKRDFFVATILAAGLSACGYSFGESFEKDVELSLTSDRAVCANTDASGVPLAAEARMTDNGGNGVCLWSASESNNICTVEVGCTFEISLKKIKENLDDYKDQIADHLTIQSFDGAVTHLEFIAKDGSQLELPETVTVTVNNTAASIAISGDTVLTSQDLLKGTLDAKIVGLIAASDVRVTSSDPLAFEASASAAAKEALLATLKMLPEKTSGYVNATMSVDLTEPGVEDFVGSLKTWKVNFKGEVEAEVGLN